MLGPRGKVYNNRAQAAMELAIFGAIVIFVVGMIVRTSVSNVYSQDINLKAMRYAMLKSLEGSKAMNTSRNTASVIYIEDRLSADFSKYGALDRAPSFAQGSGTFTNLLFYPVDYEEVENNISTTDIYINGVHLPLTTSRLHNIQINPPDIKEEVTACNRINDACRADSSNCPPVYCFPNQYERKYAAADVPDPNHDGSYRYHGWDFKCVAGTGAVAPGTGWTGTSLNSIGVTDTDDTGQFFGCQLFYRMVPNLEATRNSGDYCTQEPCKGALTKLNERFDLNRNDDFTDDPKDNSRTKIPRQYMSWQWNAVKGIFDKASQEYSQYDVNNDRREETLYWTLKFDNADARASAEAAEEQRISNKYKIVLAVNALDSRGGDLDLTHDDSDQGTVGLLTDTAIYTRPRKGPGATGSYLEIREGKLFEAGSNTVVRSANKRDSVDIVERRIRLANSTGRYCQVDPITGFVTRPVCIAGDCSKYGNNPVEVCTASTITDLLDVLWLKSQGLIDPMVNATVGDDCFSGNNVKKTCLDMATGMLYVRSRMSDKQGHKWITDASSNVGVGTTRGAIKWGELNVK